MMTINILGLLLIAAIVWWFWIYKTEEISVSGDEITIIVENGIYQPSRIKLPTGKPTTVHFLRKDTSPCSATVIIPDIGISEDLPINKTTSIKIPPLDMGEYPFHCQMQMYKGLFLVE